MDAGLRNHIASVASGGAKQAQKFHFLNRAEKNQAAAEQALDQIGFAAADSSPLFAKNFATLRSLDEGTPASVKLLLNTALLESLASRALDFTGQGVHGSLGVLSDLVRFRDGLGPQTADIKNQLYSSANRAFDQIAASSENPVAQVAAQLGTTSLYRKMEFADVSLESATKDSLGRVSGTLFELANPADHSFVNSLLADRAMELSTTPDEKATAQLLMGLNEYRLDNEHSYLANKAFPLWGHAFGYEIADSLREEAPSEEAAQVIERLQESIPDLNRSSFFGRRAT